MDLMEFGIYAVAYAIVGIILAICFIVSGIGYYKMFKKAGRTGWTAFIPLFRDYVCFKMSWAVRFFWISTASLIAYELISDSSSLILSLVGIAAGIVYLACQAMMCIRLAKSFGKTTLWGVLLFFFPFVVSLILGFGSATYTDEICEG